MRGEQLPLLLGVFAIWGVLVAIKAITCATTGKRYVFSMLDGGLLRAGKRLSARGALAKAVTASGMALGCVLLLAHALPLRPWMYVVMAFAIASVVCDFIFDDSD